MSESQVVSQKSQAESLDLQLVEAVTNEQIAVIRELFLEYAATLGFRLCFQDFDDELASLPGIYAPPSGRLLLAEVDGVAVGCAALTDTGSGYCEMKRLYVKPSHRGLDIGRKLVDHILADAREIGYRKMRLDTIRTMKQAIALYESVGFVEIGQYRHNPIEGTRYFELEL